MDCPPCWGTNNTHAVTGQKHAKINIVTRPPEQPGAQVQQWHQLPSRLSVLRVVLQTAVRAALWIPDTDSGSQRLDSKEMEVT